MANKLHNYKSKYTIPARLRDVLKWDPDFLLLDRDYLLLWFSQFSTLFGGGILGIAVAILADTGELVDEGLSSSGSAMGMVLLLNNLPSFFVALFAGVLADWYDRKKIMIFSNIFRIVILAIFLLLTGWEYVFIAYAVIFLMSAAKQFFIPSEASLIPDIVKDKNILSANSIFNLTNYGTYLLGFVLAGGLLDVLGAKWLVFILTLGFVLSSVALYFLRVPEREVKKIDVKGFLRLVKEFSISFVEGLRYIFKDKMQRIALLHNLISQSFLYMFLALIFKLGEFMIGLTANNIGFVSIVPLGIGVLASVILMDIRYKYTKRFKLSFWGVFIEFVTFVILSIAAMIRFHSREIAGIDADTSVLVLTLTGAIFMGFGFPFLIIPTQTLIQEKTQKGFLGRVYGVWMALSQAIASIPAVIVGYVADAFDIGVPATLVWISTFAFFYLFYIYRYRNLA